MLTVDQFRAKMKQERDMLARNECPPGWVRCPNCQRPTQEHHFVGPICGVCDQQRRDDAMSAEIERHPIIPPRLRR